MKKRISLIPVGLIFTLSILSTALLAAAPAAEQKSIPITVTTAGTENLEVWQVSQGKLLAKSSPLIAAEVGGRVVSVNFDVGQEVVVGQLLAEIDAADYKLARELASADIVRLESLIKAQQLQVTRFQKLVQQKSANLSALDDATAQLGSLQAQMVGARVRLQQAERNVIKTRIISPVSGRVNQRKISVGDYIQKGTPVFQITMLKTLQAHLSYPEALSSQIKVGQTVRLTSPVVPENQVESQVTEISPEISPSNLALKIIIDLANPGGWEPGASVRGEVRTQTHENAVVVKEGSIIRRPSGLVVYKIEQDKAIQTPVTTGLRKDGNIEIISGVQAGDQLALDGAAYLTEGASVKITAGSKGDAQ